RARRTFEREALAAPAKGAGYRNGTFEAIEGHGRGDITDLVRCGIAANMLGKAEFRNMPVRQVRLATHVESAEQRGHVGPRPSDHEIEPNSASCRPWPTDEHQRLRQVDVGCRDVGSEGRH